MPSLRPHRTSKGDHDLLRDRRPRLRADVAQVPQRGRVLRRRRRWSWAATSWASWRSRSSARPAAATGRRSTAGSSTSRPTTRSRRSASGSAFLGFYDIVMDEDEYRADPGRSGGGRRAVRQARDRAPERWIDLAETQARRDRHPLLRDRRQRRPARGDGRHGPARTRSRSSAARAGPSRSTTAHVMVSMPYVNPTPWQTPREAPEPELAERIDRVAGELADYGQAIFNFHAPPDRFDARHLPAARLDDRSAVADRPRRAAGPVRRRQQGRPRRRSSATSRCSACTATSTNRRRRPGSAAPLCINPGSEYGEGVLRGCLITLADGKVKGYQMTAG